MAAQQTERLLAFVVSIPPRPNGYSIPSHFLPGLGFCQYPRLAKVKKQSSMVALLKQLHFAESSPAKSRRCGDLAQYPVCFARNQYP